MNLSLRTSAEGCWWSQFTCLATAARAGGPRHRGGRARPAKELYRYFIGLARGWSVRWAEGNSGPSVRRLTNHARDPRWQPRNLVGHDGQEEHCDIPSTKRALYYGGEEMTRRETLLFYQHLKRGQDGSYYMRSMPTVCSPGRRHPL
jgi:hypothetical protein